VVKCAENDGLLERLTDQACDNTVVDGSGVRGDLSHTNDDVTRTCPAVPASKIPAPLCKSNSEPVGSLGDKDLDDRPVPPLNVVLLV
jgi:hypothetical protein